MKDMVEHPFSEEELRGELNAPLGEDEPFLPLHRGCIGVVVKRQGYFLELDRGGGGRARVLKKSGSPPPVAD